MRDAYAVSHLYDESGSAKARHYEALGTAEKRRLIREFRRSGQGLRHRALARLNDVFAVLTGKVERRAATRVVACSDC
jgi:hypothetical protein